MFRFLPSQSVGPQDGVETLWLLVEDPFYRMAAHGLCQFHGLSEQCKPPALQPHGNERTSVAAMTRPDGTRVMSIVRANHLDQHRARSQTRGIPHPFCMHMLMKQLKQQHTRT